MKTIEVDDDLYSYIASQTQHIGESASDILRRLLPIHSEQKPDCAPSLSKKTPRVAENPRHDIADRISLMQQQLNSEHYAQQKRTINRFMMILSTLYRVSADDFAAATQSLQGRTRRYFATDQQTLLQHGVHTKPKPITGTPYWVITNTNTGRKCRMIEHIMLAMAFPKALTNTVCSTL